MNTPSMRPFGRALRSGLCAAAILAGSAAAPAKTVQIPYAQVLVDYLLFNYPDMAEAGIHAVAPKSGEMTLVAASRGPTGAPSDPIVRSVMRSGKPLAIPVHDAGCAGVLLPMFDDGGGAIGVLSLAIKTGPGVPGDRTLARAEAIRDYLQLVTPQGRLFDPYVTGCDATDTLAQRINQTLLARHPDVAVIAIHLTRPGDGFNRVWGINRPDFLGRKSDSVDTDTEKTGRIVMQVIPSSHRLEVHLPLLAPDGSRIGTICTVYLWREIGEAADYYGRSLAIMNEARTLTPRNRDDLFRP